MIAEGRVGLRPADDPVVAAKILLDDEYERLANGALYWVSPEMTQVASAAAETLPEDLRIDETHQPANRGLIVFGEPVGSYIGDMFRDRQIPIAAMTWGSTFYPTKNDPAIGVTFYSSSDYEYVRHVLPRIVGRKPKSAELDRAIRATPEWMWDNETALRYGHTIGDLNLAHEISRTPQDQSVIPWLKVLYSSWLLMTQPGITEVSQERAGRNQQRRDQREGRRNSDVQVVHVHRRHRDAAPTNNQTNDAGDEREFAVRWMVRGHWRNQAYGPNRQLRRPVWINPHIKGPDDKPFKTGNVVHVWDR
ncbi:hypothetical protein [Amycolatopsis sp. GM8]|uniref:hypothetical protein n=1 Tax=Amycolatopsis sp. GM8 TaxID=2896530 RepID=UPI001F4919EF|nr:hypothetical protein [Amycolatopsis sp. GM8]